MKTYKITVAGKEIDVLQNEDGSFNKPNIVKELESYGTALKPAFEPICMAMKPLSEKNYVSNVLKYGTGGINIDGSRVGETGARTNSNGKRSMYGGNSLLESKTHNDTTTEHNYGRFPANLIHDNSEEVRECFPDTKTGKAIRSNSGGKTFGGENTKPIMEDLGYEDGGGSALRFFKSIIYQAKASKSERNKGCEGLEEKELKGMNASPRETHGEVRDVSFHKNNHPTVKPIALMEYLIKMVTPKGGIVLDPFAGSGSTLVAAKQNGFQYIGIELEPEYIKIAKARLDSVPERLL